ncbi:MAG: RluA family pseudouridine synthase [Planctomycetota bacterium]
MNNNEKKEFVVEKNYNDRIDIFLVKRIHEISRNKLQELIKSGDVLVNGNKVKPSYKIKEGDKIKIVLTTKTQKFFIKINIRVYIIYEDECLLAVNKEPGIVSHPAGRYRENTLIQGVYNYFEEKGVLDKLITPIFKPTLIHRLDKDTSGVILIAKTLECYYALQKQFMQRVIYKEYWAIVEGDVKFDSDLIEKKIDKSKTHFAKMTAGNYGKESQTIYKVQERFKNFTLVSAIPRTGRTHQIRVHLASIGYPVLCDSVYGRRKMLYEWQLKNFGREKSSSANLSCQYFNQPPLIARQALHAKKIEFKHPLTSNPICLDAQLPVDFKQTLECLRKIK